MNTPKEDSLKNQKVLLLSYKSFITFIFSCLFKNKMDFDGRCILYFHWQKIKLSLEIINVIIRINIKLLL
jgi:hypothetical protein